MNATLAAGVVAALALAGRAPEQQVGLPLFEKVELEDFANVEASSWEQFTGRAVLIEFFAHW